MITPDEIRKKALRHWDSGGFLRSWASRKSFFPLNIPFGKKGGGFIADNFVEVRQRLSDLHAASKAGRGFGYSVEYTPITHRLLGKQEIPGRITIETEEDFLGFLGKKKEFLIFKNLFEKTGEIIPELLPYVTSNPCTLLKNGPSWLNLLAVCRYFMENPRPGIYLRQMVIPGIDTKFVESHKKILGELLDVLLPAEHMNREIEGISYNGFERRYGLRYEEPLIRFRILDGGLYIQGLSDISLPLSDFASLSLPVRRIFITENKINGLVFPPEPGALVIFGLGYGIQSLNEIHWLQDRDIFYWGDIDTHGFNMLSIMRGIFPRCRSFLMDEGTLMDYRHCWEKEPEGKRYLAGAANLTEEEALLFFALKEDRHGASVRLEQEWISFDTLRSCLEAL